MVVRQVRTPILNRHLRKFCHLVAPGTVYREVDGAPFAMLHGMTKVFSQVPLLRIARLTRCTVVALLRRNDRRKLSAYNIPEFA